MGIDASDSPAISVIMPTFNQAAFIEESVRSILDQSFESLEVIVQDGGSTDSTPQILERIAEVDSRLKWSSAPDSGPADALNKAMARTEGDVIGWLNSDDLYAPGALERVVAEFSNRPRMLLLYGHADHIDAIGEHLGKYPTREPELGLEGMRAGCFICQPSAFFRPALYWSLGRFDTALETAFDYDFWLRAFRSVPERIGFIDQILARSRLHDNCITNRMRESVALEGLALGKRYFASAPSHWAATHLEEILTTQGIDRATFAHLSNSFLDKAKQFLDQREFDQMLWARQSILERPLQSEQSELDLSTGGPSKWY